MTSKGEGPPPTLTSTQRQILQFLVERPWSTPSVIASDLGIEQGSVSAAIGPASAEGTARTTQTARGNRRRLDLRSVLESSGRRPERHAIKVDAGAVVAIDLGARHWRVAISSLAQEGPELRAGDHADVLHDPTLGLRLAADAVAELITKERTLSPKRIAGVVVGVPVGVDRQGRPQTELDAWDALDLPFDVQQALDLDVPVTIERDACLGAVAEHNRWITRDRERKRQAGAQTLIDGSPTTVYVKWSASVSGAVVIDRTIHRGDSDRGDWFLHVAADDPLASSWRPSQICPVCDQACVAANAGLHAVFEAIEQETSHAIDGNGTEERAVHAVRLAREHPEVEVVLDRAGRMVGRALGYAISTLAPHQVFVGGAFKFDDAAKSWEHVRGALHAGIKQVVPKPVRFNLPRNGEFVGEAALIGALTLARQQYAVPYLCRKLEGRPARGRRSPQRVTAEPERVDR